MKSLIDPVTYPLSPDHINIGQHFFDGFNNREREISARWIVEFCQKRGLGWQSFTADDINAFYHDKGRPETETFSFNGLPSDGYLVLKDGRYHFTHEFISSCFRAAPAL
jgi:hypothetical protein